VILAVPAVVWRNPAFFNLYLAWRVWVCSVAAVVALDAIQAGAYTPQFSST
jgi:hypothetical protein